MILRLSRSVARSEESSVSLERLEDILTLPEERLLKLEGVGKTYQEDWHQLKTLYSQADGEFLPREEQATVDDEPSYELQDDMLLNLTQLDAHELKAIAKLERALGKADIHTLLHFGSAGHAAVATLGNSSRSRLAQVRDRLREELRQIADGTLDYRTSPNSLITAPTQPFETVAELGDFLLDRLDGHLGRLDAKSQEIFQSRWGFVDERLTLMQIGEKFDVTRERIRQLESRINQQLLDYLNLDADAFWDDARGLPQRELRLQMGNLHDCFPEPLHFHEFLEFISRGRLVSPASASRLSSGILDDYFAQHGTALDELRVLEHLQDLTGLNRMDACNALHDLQAQGRVALGDGQVYPRGLGKREAAAAVLSEHPNGLPWLDIARHANQRGISRSSFSEQISGHGLQDSELMYVAGKGVYRHTRFVDFAGIDDIAIFDALHAYFASTDREVSHLSEAHGDSAALREYDYYIVRYIVKMRGEPRGIYFNGKSQTDSISLNPEFELYSQKSVILQSLQRSRAPMTKSEIAQLLKSRSLRHASLYINELSAANQIVQVDRMLYTTPELAYENIDLESMRQDIEAVLLRQRKPVDPSVIQVELNRQRDETYSKYFYGSLARYFAQQQHWQRRQNLFSLQPIPFASLTAAIETLCGTDTNMEVNIAALRLHVAITEDAAKVSLYNWKAAKTRQGNGGGGQEMEEELEND